MYKKIKNVVKLCVSISFMNIGIAKGDPTEQQKLLNQQIQGFIYRTDLKPIHMNFILYQIQQHSFSLDMPLVQDQTKRFVIKSFDNTNEQDTVCIFSQEIPCPENMPEEWGQLFERIKVSFQDLESLNYLLNTLLQILQKLHWSIVVEDSGFKVRPQSSATQYQIPTTLEQSWNSLSFNLTPSVNSTRLLLGDLQDPQGRPILDYRIPGIGPKEILPFVDLMRGQDFSQEHNQLMFIYAFVSYAVRLGWIIEMDRTTRVFTGNLIKPSNTFFLDALLGALNDFDWAQASKEQIEQLMRSFNTCIGEYNIGACFYALQSAIPAWRNLYTQILNAERATRTPEAVHPHPPTPQIPLVINVERHQSSQPSLPMRPLDFDQFLGQLDFTKEYIVLNVVDAFIFRILSLGYVPERDPISGVLTGRLIRNPNNNQPSITEMGGATQSQNRSYAEVIQRLITVENAQSCFYTLRTRLTMAGIYWQDVVENLRNPQGNMIMDESSFTQEQLQRLNSFRQFLTTLNTRDMKRVKRIVYAFLSHIKNLQLGLDAAGNIVENYSNITFSTVENLTDMGALNRAIQSLRIPELNLALKNLQEKLWELLCPLQYSPEKKCWCVGAMEL